MSKEVNISNDQDTAKNAENEIGNIPVSNYDNNTGINNLEENGCDNIEVNNQDSNINTIVSKLEVSKLEESNTTLTSSGWNDNLEESNTILASSGWDDNLEKSNITLTSGGWDESNTTERKLDEIITKVIIGDRNTSIINWEESDITGLERCNINKLIDAFLRYRWENEKKYKWEKHELEKKQIIEIIRHLAYNNSYKVHGYWICHQWQCRHGLRCGSTESCKRRYYLYSRDCQHKPQCQNRVECRNKYNLRQWQRENFCQREWQNQYDQELLKQYLEVIPKRFEWLGLFIRICDKHGDDGGNLISSFLLYNPKNSNEKPDMEIIRHLVWNDKYRVFGNWGCSSCRKRWRSAYTWISLQKYIEKTPGKRLKRFNDDYIIQKCKKEECGDDGIILSYEHLVLSEGDVEHKRHLCAKCLNGEVCLESGTYYGKQK